MSSRALRKVQKEREKLDLQKQGEDIVDDGEEDEENEVSIRTGKPSVFALLDEDGDVDNNEEESVLQPEEAATQTTDEEDTQDIPATSTPKESASKRKKKKKKTKGKGVGAETQTSPKSEGMDEIDRALKSLSMGPGGSGTHENILPNAADPATLEVCQLLSIDTHHLNVANEMRRLFGRAAFAVDREEEAAAAPARQRFAEAEGMSLSEAVKGKHTPGGAGLPAVLRRRNILFPGKEDWPRATGGGLSMDIVQTHPGGIVEYRFMHNESYQRTQREFEMCVLSMNPSTMVRLLSYNPYHVSTLLQVSEIAKHEKDYATSGDLLERAIFSFGRAAHSTFGANVAQGKARLDFRRPENREFWLACWRYIGNISMRATWRTAYEWARLLLSLDPENDPYCVSLIIDQLALRAKQASTFLQLCDSAFFKARWADLPNIHFSRCLAARESTTTPPQAILEATISRFPWVAARLLQELETDTLPKAVWGKTAGTPLEALYTELYATTAKDLWKATGAAALLLTAATSAEAAAEAPITEASTTITHSLARFTILSDKPSLISLLPRELTALFDNAADPLPPKDSLSSYSIDMSSVSGGGGRLRGQRTLTDDLAARAPPLHLIRDDPHGFIEELHTFQRFFELLIPGFAAANEAARAAEAGHAGEGGTADAEPPSAQATGGSSQGPNVPGAWVSEDAEHDPEAEPTSISTDESLSPQLHAPPSQTTPTSLANLEITDEVVDHAISRSNLSPSELRACLARLVALRSALVVQPGQSVREGGTGDEVTMTREGALRFVEGVGTGQEAERARLERDRVREEMDDQVREAMERAGVLPVRYIGDDDAGIVEEWGSAEAEGDDAIGEREDAADWLYRTHARMGAATGMARPRPRPEELDDEELARALFEEEATQASLERAGRRRQ